MKNIDLRLKLIIGFVMITIITILVGCIGLQGLLFSQQTVREMEQVRLPGINALQVIGAVQQAVARDEYALLAMLLDEPGRKMAEVAEPERFDEEMVYERMAEAVARADEARKVYEALPQAAEVAGLWQAFIPAWDSWLTAHAEYVRRAQNGMSTPTDENHQTVSAQAWEVNRVSFATAEELLLKLMEASKQTVGRGAQSGVEAIHHRLLLLGMAMAAGVMLSLMLGIIMARSLDRLFQLKLSELTGEPSPGAGAQGGVHSVRRPRH